MSKRSLGLLVEDIWESIEKIERYTKGMSQDSFQSDEKTTDAVVRNLEIIGEAAGRLPKNFALSALRGEAVRRGEKIAGKKQLQLIND
jgi:uncharacterized protein with HEPN domain